MKAMTRLKHYLRLAASLQLLPALEGGEEVLVGGQAVIEGGMMRSPHAYCVAGRKPSGELTTQTEVLARPTERHKIWKYPVLRGLGTVGQALVLGIRALRFSANSAMEADNPKAAAENTKKTEISSWVMAANLV